MNGAGSRLARRRQLGFRRITESRSTCVSHELKPAPSRAHHELESNGKKKLVAPVVAFECAGSIKKYKIFQSQINYDEIKLGQCLLYHSVQIVYSFILLSTGVDVKFRVSHVCFESMKFFCARPVL